MKEHFMKFAPAGFARVALTALLSGCVYHPGIQPLSRSKRVSEAASASIRASVEALSTRIGERNLYRPRNLEAAARYIEERFRAFGYTPVRLPVPVEGDRFSVAPTTAWNIEAVLEGASRPDEHLVIGAHYDTKVAMPGWHDHDPPTPENPGTPGANDNGSGTAAMLALAESFSGRPRARTIRFVAFVNEEPPFYQTDAMGSVAYARRLRSSGYDRVRMISLETLGCYSDRPRKKRIGLASLLGLPDRSDYVAFLTNLASRRFTEDALDWFASTSTVEARMTALPDIAGMVAWSDDWAFWQEGYPAFTVTDTAFFRSDDYHELGDTADKLDYGTMSEVVTALQKMTEALADAGSW